MCTAGGTILHCQHLITHLEDPEVGLIHHTAGRLCGRTDWSIVHPEDFEVGLIVLELFALGVGGTRRGAGQFAPHSVITGRIPNGFGHSAGIMGTPRRFRFALVRG